MLKKQTYAHKNICSIKYINIACSIYLMLFVYICLQGLIITLTETSTNHIAVLLSPVLMNLQQNSFTWGQGSLKKTEWKHCKNQSNRCLLLDLFLKTVRSYIYQVSAAWQLIYDLNKNKTNGHTIMKEGKAQKISTKANTYSI